MRSPETSGKDSETKMNEAVQVFEELVVTEGRYVQRLEALQEIRQRITHRTEHLKSDTKEVQQALDPPGLEAIISLHKNEILPQLQSRCPELCFGSIFSSKYIAPYFKVYAEFLSRKDIFDNRIHKLRQNQHVRPHLTRAESEDIPQLLNGLKLSLNALLLEPVQRLPRYELLLRDYIKRLPDEHGDKSAALEAQKIIQEANQRNNMRKAEAESQGKLASLAKSISGLNELVDGRRNLIFHGYSHRLGQRHYKPKKVEVLLLSDMIIIVIEKGIGRGKEAKHKLQLSGIFTETMEMPVFYGKSASDIRSVNGLRLSSTTETIDLIDADEELSNSNSVKEINALLQEEIEKWRSKQETFRGMNQLEANFHFRLGERAPRLVHESDVSMCMICWKMFGFGSGRHHCRACGNILCSNCSNHQLPLNYSKSGSPMTVCVPCYKHLRNTLAVPAPRMPQHFDDLWRKCNKQGYLRVRRKDDSEFQKCWCAIIPSWGTAEWIFTARKAPCDTGPFYEKPLNSCQFAQVVPHNVREWNLVLGTERFYILLEDKDTKNDWVTAIRHGIQVSENIKGIAGDVTSVRSLPSRPDPDSSVNNGNDPVIRSRTTSVMMSTEPVPLRSASPAYAPDGTKSLDRAAERTGNQRDMRVRSMHEPQLGISYPQEVCPDYRPSDRLHSLRHSSRVSRSQSLRSDVSPPISAPFVHHSSSPHHPHVHHPHPRATLHQSPNSHHSHQRISNRSIRNQLSASSLDDVYLNSEAIPNDSAESNPDEEKRSGTFSRGIKERFSARFKLSRLVSGKNPAGYKHIKPGSKSP